MRSFILFISIIILLVINAVNYAQVKTYFDVKTKFYEKSDLSPAKIGTIIFLTQSNWGGVREVGEDYSLWLKKYERKKINKTITIQLDVELRTPAAIRSGSLLSSQRIEVSFKAEDDWKGVNSIQDAIRREMSNKSREIQKEALFVGEEIVNVAYSLIKKNN